jgi:DHA1 family bicyclomycin/chloramphenicol resistance-like MFS transporter
MGVSTTSFGLLFALTSCGILVGSAISSFLARRGVASRGPLGVGLALAPLAALGAAAVTGAGIVSVATFIPFVVVVGICRGVTTPNITHAALEPVPQHAGVTSALMGSGQMLCMAVASVVVAQMHAALGALGVALTMLGFLSAGLAAWLLVERAVRHGQPAGEPV